MLFDAVTWGSEWVTEGNFPKFEYKNDLPSWVKEAIYNCLVKQNSDKEIEVYYCRPIMNTGHTRINLDGEKQTLFSFLWKIHIKEPTTNEKNKWITTTYTIRVSDIEDRELLVYKDVSTWEVSNDVWTKVKDSNSKKVISFQNKTIVKDLF